MMGRCAPPGRAADGLAGLVAVHRRHFHVHEHGVAGAGFDRRHRRGAVGGLGNQESRALQRAAHQQPRAGVVVDDEYVDAIAPACVSTSGDLGRAVERFELGQRHGALRAQLGERGGQFGQVAAARRVLDLRARWPRRWWRRGWRWSS